VFKRPKGLAVMSEQGRNDDIASALRQVLSGDVEYYEIVYKLCDSRLRAFIGAHWGRHGSDFVDEVAIRTHERALRSLAQFDAERGQFQTWLNWLGRSVASQVAAGWYGPRFTALDEAADVRYVPSLPGPDELRERQLRDRALREAFESLDREGRLTLLYHDLAGMSFAATAADLGWTVKRVRCVRDCALRQLRRRLNSPGQIRP